MNTERASKKLAKELASVRRKRIQRLKSKIASGTYSISAAALAKALFLAR